MNRGLNRQSSPVSLDVAYPFLYTSSLFFGTENEAMKVKLIHQAETFNMIFIPGVGISNGNLKQYKAHFFPK